MRLILSTRHPRNSIYTTETGKPLYKVDKPLTFFRTEVATMRKAVNTVDGVWDGSYTTGITTKRATSPNSTSSSNNQKEPRLVMDDNDRHSVDQNFAPDSDDEEPSSSSPADDEGHFAFYAQVEFHSFQSTRFRYNGLDVSAKDFFRKEGWSWFGRGRVFRASDGKEYRWDLRAGHLEMIINDGSKRRMAKFREKRHGLGPLLKGRPASLEVDDSCEPILDEIVMTFLYCEKLRKDRERQARQSGGGGGGGGGD